MNNRSRAAQVTAQKQAGVAGQFGELPKGDNRKVNLEPGGDALRPADRCREELVRHSPDRPGGRADREPGMIGHEKFYLAQYGVTGEDVMAQYGTRFRLKLDADGILWAPVGGNRKRVESLLKSDAETAGTGNWAPEAIAARQAAYQARKAEEAARAEEARLAKIEAEKNERAAAVEAAQAAVRDEVLATPKQIAYIARLIRAGAHEEGGFMVVRPDINFSTLTRREASRMIDSMTGRY